MNNNTNKDVESSKNPGDFDVLLVKMLEDRKQDNNKDVS